MQITEYSFGRITINGKTYHSDVIITTNEVKADWWRKQGHNLAIVDLTGILQASPEVLIIGSGYFGRMQVPEAMRSYLEERGIKTDVLPTSEAVEKFNELQQKCTRLVAALHLTC